MDNNSSDSSQLFFYAIVLQDIVLFRIIYFGAICKADILSIKVRKFMESTMIKITVVMPAYRENKQQISQAIESILNQSYQEFCYIIILDDPDNTELEELIRSYAENDKRITLYVNEKNMGCPWSKDRGIRLAQTEYVAIMDSDDVARTDRLEKELYTLENNQLDLVGAYVSVVDEEGRHLYDMDNLPLTHDKIAKRMKVNNCVPHPTWFMRKEMYINLGGYTDMQGGEDYDFLLRAIDQGYKMGIADEILLDYRLSTHSISRNNLYKQYLMMKYLQDKYFYHKLSVLSYEEYEKEKYSEKKARSYASASVLFEHAIAAKAERRYIKMFMFVLRTMLSSKEYAGKIMRYVIQEI